MFLFHFDLDWIGKSKVQVYREKYVFLDIFGFSEPFWSQIWKVLTLGPWGGSFFCRTKFLLQQRIQMNILLELINVVKCMTPSWNRLVLKKQLRYFLISWVNLRRYFFIKVIFDVLDSTLKRRGNGLRLCGSLFESPFGVWNFVKLKCIQPWTDPVFPFNCSNNFHSFDTQFPGNHHKQEDSLINCCHTSNDLLRKDFLMLPGS